MNTPLLLTSVALLSGVAARPVDRQHDDLVNQGDAQSQNDNRQVYLHNPNTDININSHFETVLNLDNIPHTPVGDNVSSSPKLVPLDSAFSDPGLSSPYMGAQRHLAKMKALGIDPGEEQRNALSMLSQMPSRPSSPAELPHSLDKDNGPRNSNSDSVTTSNVPSSQSDYSPMIAVMIVSSLGALVLLGLAVAVVYVSQLLRLTVLQGSVWRTITNANKMDSSNISTSDKPKVHTSELGKLITEEDLNEKASMALTRQIFSALLQSDPEKNLHPEQVPEVVIPPSSPALREPPTDNNLVFGRAIVAWTHDNWLTHFMFVLFGWMGMFLRRSGQGAPN